LFSLDKLANVLVLILLIEMMVATGLGVSLSDLAGVVKNAGLLARAALANYVLVPAAAILLLYLFQTEPIVAAGFILVAVCPAAPFAPPLTAMAKGSVHVSVGFWINVGFGGVLCNSRADSVECPLASDSSRDQLENRYIQDCDDAVDGPNPAPWNRDVGSLQASEVCGKAAKASESAERSP
jgi:hypothetical protein